MVEHGEVATVTDTTCGGGGGGGGDDCIVDAHMVLKLQSELGKGRDEDEEAEDGEGDGGNDGEGEGYVDDEEEEGDDNGDDDDDEEDERDFQFQGGMDPLTLAEEDSSGMQLYERLEQLGQHYEALAAKKRIAAQQSVSEMPAKRLRLEEGIGASFEEIMETMNYSMGRKSRKRKKRGRRKGSRRKVNPEAAQKLGVATLHFAHRRFEEAISLLKEVIHLAPNLSEAYRLLGDIYNELADKKRSLSFYMITALLTPKDASLWNLLFHQSLDLGDKRQANYCLGKAITANPDDVDLQMFRASLYIELGEFQKAAVSYEQISRLRPHDLEVIRKATQCYKQCGQRERAVCFLEEHLNNDANDLKLSVVELLASVLMESKKYDKAVEHIEHALREYGTEKEASLNLNIKAGVCHAHLGHMEKAEDSFNVLKPENAATHSHLIIEVGKSLMAAEQYESALKYYMMLEKDADKYNGYLDLQIARCHTYLRKATQAIKYYYRAIQVVEGDVDARLTLASLLLEQDRDDEAISVLSPPLKSGTAIGEKADLPKLWWHDGKIKLKLSQVYRAKGSLDAFADILFSVIRETLFLETVRRKIKLRKRLSRSTLAERVKILDDQPTDGIFCEFRPVASSADIQKASRAKKLLQKKKAAKEANRAATLAAGLDWTSDDSEDEFQQVFREPPLPNLLKDEEHHQLIIDLCQSLSSSRRYWDALEIINLSLKLAGNMLSIQRKEELRILGAQIAHNISDPSQGWDCVRYIVSRHPYSFSAWNCYYKGILRTNRFTKHNKFLHSLRAKHKDSVPPILISAHHFTVISQHQAAAREYLEAYKLMPDNPLINLCAGTALINLALGHRIPNKHQTLLQGLSFLHNNARLCDNSQEALYNIARAYHHVGLVTLAATYYERVLSMYVKDYPVPVLPNENPDPIDSKGKMGFCDLRREAAYNLHLIYNKSGAFDLARQVLKDHLVL